MGYLQIFYISVIIGYNIVIKLPYAWAYNSEFADVVHAEIFVDKTDMIIEYFSEIEMVVVAAPEGFGKTTNMDMMKRYCEVVFDDQGNRIPPNETENYKLFTARSMDIYENQTVFNKEFGQHSVIHLNFKQLSSLNYDLFLRSFRNIIRQEYLRHRFLFSSNLVPESLRNSTMKYISDEEYIKLNEYQLYTSMEELCKMLAAHFNNKCFLMIDNYDTAIERAMTRYGSPLTEITHFLIEFVSFCARDFNPIKRMLINVEFSIEGVIHAASMHITFAPFLIYSTFSHNFGFTEYDMVELLEKHKAPHSIAEIKQWYNGYTVATTEAKIYNTYAVVQYLKEKKLTSYSCLRFDQTIDELFTFDLVREKIELIFEDYEHKTGLVSIKHIYMLKFKDILQLQEVIRANHHNNTEAGADLILQFLADKGFFNITRDYFRSYITIPNLNAKHQIELRTNTFRFYEHQFKRNYLSYYTLPKLFFKLDLHPTMYQRLTNTLDLLYSSYKNSAPYNEYALQRHIVFTLNNSKMFEEILCDGRTGLFLFSMDDKVLIVQFRVGQESAYEALAQAVNKTYKHPFTEMRVHLGLHLSREGKCTLSYLVNSHDLEKAKNVTANY